MGKLYSFGCSHTAGTPNINTTDDEFTKSQVKYWKSKTYPSYVAKEFGLENINCAIGGGSHKDVYRIFFTTLPKITTDDFVILQPTFPHRRDLQLMYEEGTFPVSITDVEAHNSEWVLDLMNKVDIPKKYLSNMKDAIYYMLMSDMVIIDSLVTLSTAMTMLELKKIKYVVCGYFQDDFMVHWIIKNRKKIYKKLKRLETGYNLNYSIWNLGETLDMLDLVNTIDEKKIIMGEWINYTQPEVESFHIPNDGHWNEKGHEVQANRLIKHIRELY